MSGTRGQIPLLSGNGVQDSKPEGEDRALLRGSYEVNTIPIFKKVNKHLNSFQTVQLGQLDMSYRDGTQTLPWAKLQIILIRSPKSTAFLCLLQKSPHPSEKRVKQVYGACFSSLLNLGDRNPYGDLSANSKITCYFHRSCRHVLLKAFWKLKESGSRGRRERSCVYF